MVVGAGAEEADEADDAADDDAADDDADDADADDADTETEEVGVVVSTDGVDGGVAGNSGLLRITGSSTAGSGP